MNTEVMFVAIVALGVMVILQGIVLRALTKEIRGARATRTPTVDVRGLNPDKIGIPLGKPFPKLKATTVDGRDFLAANDKRSLVIISVTGCEHCRNMLPGLNALAQRGIVNVWLFQVGSRIAAEDLQREFPHVWVLPSDKDLVEQINTKIFPFGYLLDPAGTVLAKNMVSNDQTLMKMVESVNVA